jgi:GPH family glycoside/pentoside/hexuronide:cation symporter
VALPPAFALTFAGPPVRGAGAALYVCLCFFAAATAFALFEVPYKAMPAEMTDDYHGQSGLLTWRIGFLGLSILLSGSIAPAIANGSGDTGTVGGYRIMGIVIAVVLLAALIGTFLKTARAPRIARVEAGGGSLREQVAAARSNRSFRLLLGFSCVQMLAAGSMLAGAPYFATYVLKDTGAIKTLFVALVGPMLVTMPLWVRIARRYDKRGGMALASALFLVGGFTLAFTPLFGAAYAHICIVVIGIGYAGLQLLQYSMLADTLIADALESGANRSGVLTGLWTAAETVIFAFGAQMLAWLLALSGFVSSEPDHPVAQSQRAINTVLIGGSAVPALLVSVAIVLTLRYDVTAERLAELRARSAARAARLESAAD